MIAAELPPLLAPSGLRLRPTVAAVARVLVVDNYDSFTFNLVQYLLELGAVVDVYRNDAVAGAAVLADRPSHVLLSPGPGRPSDSGVCQELCRVLADPAAPAIPMLGVCLGHQTLCEVHGATVERAARIMHGKLSPVLHDGTGVFAGLPSPFMATRYHSLVAQEFTLPPFLLPVARTDVGELMGVRHSERPLFGVQFHPESILSEHGHALLKNFLDTCPEGQA
ncbi:MAG: aminodeoxychorismate/anthranilate synthase component II [Myxococcales bacterium]|nr:aminodeoxychorismate/anthranilate synthase component II [Myxococcales bacterium]